MPRKGGWTRRGSRRDFRYHDARGRRITDHVKLERIESLRIPAGMAGRLDLAALRRQAAGDRNRRGRAPPIPVPDFRARQKQEKFDRLIRFARKLPELREQMTEHFELDSLAPERVCAIAVRLINLGWFRVGSEEYARPYRSFGITTLHKRHVTVRGRRMSFSHAGKRRIWVRTALVDGDLADALRELKELSGSGRLFRSHNDEGELVNLTSSRLNEYIRSSWTKSSARRTSARGAAPCSQRSPSRNRPGRDRSAGQTHARRRHAHRRREARQHACRRAGLIRQPGRRRPVPRGADARAFPATPFALGRRPRSRA